MAEAPFIEVRNLKKYFPVRGSFGRKKLVRAVDDVTLSIYQGETLGVIGESGSGKSTLGRTITRLYEPTGGTILFKGQDTAKFEGKALAGYKRSMQIVFQDPYSSLNPAMNVLQLVAEPLDLVEPLPKEERRARVVDMLRQVGLDEDTLEKYPHEFSGGQLQRVGIARALIVRPEFILCDEPISALDVSIGAQVINLLQDLQASMGLTTLFVAHDLSMVRHISNRIGVMYLGRLVELSPADDLYTHPQHPYSQALLSAIPIADPRKAQQQQRLRLSGDPPSPMQLIPGCAFASRCPLARQACSQVRPVLQDSGNGRQVACFAVTGWPDAPTAHAPTVE